MHFPEKIMDNLHLTVTILYEFSYFETTSVTAIQLDLHCSYDLSVLIWCCTTPLIFVCLCACRLAAPSHVHHPERRSKPVPKSLRRISPSSLYLSLSPLTPFFNILTGLWNNNKLTGLPKVYALVDVTLCL